MHLQSAMECNLSIVINKDYHLSITAAKKHWPEVWTGSTVYTRKNNSQLNLSFTSKNAGVSSNAA